MSTDLLSYIYAATVAAGGCLGYIRSGNVFWNNNIVSRKTRMYKISHISDLLNVLFK